MDPRAHGVLSTFNHDHGILSLKSGQRGTDSRSWTVVSEWSLLFEALQANKHKGFDVGIFARSVRNFPASKAIHCPYKLRGTYHEYDAYGKDAHQWNRRREVVDQILCKFDSFAGFYSADRI